MHYTVKMVLSLLLTAQFFNVGSAYSQSLDRFDLSLMEYEGAFRFPHGTFGAARVVGSSGTIVVDEIRNRFFFVGSNHTSIGEFALPESLSKSTVLSDLPMIPQPRQNFTEIIARASTGNPNEVNRITGMFLSEDKLVVNASVYYDGSGSNLDTTLIVEDAEDLTNSSIRGFMQLEGAYHASGWISSIPDRWVESLGGDIVFGNANNLSINSRASVGPTFFSAQMSEVLSAEPGEKISSNKILDFSIDNPLSPDYRNATGENQLWTELSAAYLGIIVPNSSTYLTIGHSGGHESGIGYKITQPNGYQCGGFCANDLTDYYNYVWLWDVNDLVNAKNGLLKSYDIRPYFYGQIKLPFENNRSADQIKSLIIGANFSKSGRLYIVLDRVDDLQSSFSTLPIVLVYNLGANSDANPPSPPSSIKLSKSDISWVNSIPAS
jgi:hypothetical protein